MLSGVTLRSYWYEPRSRKNGFLATSPQGTCPCFISNFIASQSLQLDVRGSISLLPPGIPCWTLPKPLVGDPSGPFSVFPTGSGNVTIPSGRVPMDPLCPLFGQRMPSAWRRRSGTPSAKWRSWESTFRMLLPAWSRLMKVRSETGRSTLDSHVLSSGISCHSSRKKATALISPGMTDYLSAPWKKRLISKYHLS